MAEAPETNDRPDQEETPAIPEAAGPRPRGPRRAAVALSVAALALVGVWVVRGVVAGRGPKTVSGAESGESRPLPPESPSPQGPSGAAPETPSAPGRRGVVELKAEDIVLSSAARMQAEKFMCVCGCNLHLSECTCQKTPGSVDMKKYLQSLVDQKLDPTAIEKAMVDKYGPNVLPRR